MYIKRFNYKEMMKRKTNYTPPAATPLSLQIQMFLCLSFNSLELTEYITSDPDEVDL